MTGPLAPIPGLRESAMFEVSVSIYRRHRDTGVGVCGECAQRAPCRPDATPLS
jgi:hypothetical protein